MDGTRKQLEKDLAEAKQTFAKESAKGVEHFKKFEKSIENLVKGLTYAQNRIDNRGIENKTLQKKVVKLEERCDVLTGQVGIVLKPS